MLSTSCYNVVHLIFGAVCLFCEASFHVWSLKLHSFILSPALSFIHEQHADTMHTAAVIAVYNGFNI